ncbi:putative endonuclease lcl3 [Claviceps purpurea]|uniref:Probable endonuclease LCL3 n=1 Tax=Claviceps purpurea (strain 20.1) TaxID=1111077 RepID=M1WIH4_CLAP2|nr:putative endonuclease lcl3 [Claviceps purpurea]CCE34484.1 related to Staphylococcus aureus nuclease (SNase) [Claviceps purpurea 20.1]KAG6136320.1 putative endonuclease lcl3 [Claviceps purpurea]KAG6138975.1 putative endonuclease lcl3 [Claviceps purpurea]KAG6151596.1 putative endonuclease lcl3 [Claviceps purpurea]
MVWPFGSRVSTKEPHDEPVPRHAVSWSELLSRAGNDPSGAAKEWAPMIFCSLAGLGALQLYANYLRRIPGAAFIRPSSFRSRSLFGRVTSVGDGDGFHLFHTPGGKTVGWGWLRKIPETRKDLKDRTISIRLAGVDAPEGAHFGRPAQPYAAEAQTWLTQYILHRNVRAYIYKRDQYNRVVATVYVRRFFIRRNVGLEMIKQGLATTYEAKSGGEYGGLKEAYEAAEASAKRQRKGMWSRRDLESPREYKARYQGSVKDQ